MTINSMESTLSFEHRNFIERSNFHRIQRFLRWTRFFICLIYFSGVVFVSFGMHRTMHRIKEVNSFKTPVYHSYGAHLQQQLFKKEIEVEGYHILNLCLFLIINTFGVVSVFFESFSLVIVYCVANTCLFALSFTDDNSYPMGVIYKLIVLALIQSGLVYYLLMRWRRVSR